MNLLKKLVNKKWFKISVASLAVIVVLIFLIMIPFIINGIYDMNPPHAIFNIDIEKGDILNYYAQLLSLMATIILGVIAVIQTYRSQKKSDEINELQLSIAQRELEVVEKQYAEAQHSESLFTPKFEVRIIGYNGNYSNLNIEMRNVSDTIISSLRFLKFIVYKDDIPVESVQRWKIRFQSLNSGEAQNFTVATNNMSDAATGYWNNVKFEWKFSCEDIRGIKHFYSAIAEIPNTREFVGDFWEVNKIG